MQCLARADAQTGKITDGPNQIYRCYAAMQEARHKHIRNLRWNNFNILRRLGHKKILKLLSESLQPLHDTYIENHQQRPIVRAHVGGDFFKEDYFLAWMDLARLFDPTQFYSYTKRIDLWVMHMNLIPSNFELNASRGGKFDDLIDIHKLKSAEVVYSLEEAKQKGLELDHDDSHAYKPGRSFGHLIHGCQPAGSSASKALQALKKEHNWTGYNTTDNSQSVQKAYNKILQQSNK